MRVAFGVACFDGAHHALCGGAFSACGSSVPQGLVYLANVGVGLMALAAVSIPLFIAIRRTTILFVLGGEMAFLGKRLSIRQSCVTAAFVCFVCFVRCDGGAQR